MSFWEWYAVASIVTAVITAVTLIVGDRGEDALGTALFGILCGLGWPLWLFALALAGMGRGLEYAAWRLFR